MFNHLLPCPTFSVNFCSLVYVLFDLHMLRYFPFLYSRFSRDVTAAMFVYRTVVKKVIWEFDPFIIQNLNYILLLFCSPTWPSHHVRENLSLDERFFVLRANVVINIV